MACQRSKSTSPDLPHLPNLAGFANIVVTFHPLWFVCKCCVFSDRVSIAEVQCKVVVVAVVVVAVVV